MALFSIRKRIAFSTTFKTSFHAFIEWNIKCLQNFALYSLSLLLVVTVFIQFSWNAPLEQQQQQQ